MALVRLTPRNLDALKKGLAPRMGGVKSAHLTEALAAGRSTAHFPGAQAAPLSKPRCMRCNAASPMRTGAAWVGASGVRDAGSDRPSAKIRTVWAIEK